MTTRTGEVFGHKGLSSADADSGEVFGHEQLSSPDSGEPVAGVCTIFSIQAVAGVGVAGCMIAGLDMGRRE